MKTKVLALLLLLAFAAPASAQLDEKGAAELNAKKLKAKQNNTVLWLYDTLYKQGQPYCLFKSKLQSEEGNEYVVKGLNNQDIIYIIEPSNVEKLLSKLTNDANVEFSFFKEKQKLNVPKKSVSSLPDFIVENDLVVKNGGNMVAAKKLLFMYSEQNPQGYTSNVAIDSIDKKDTKKDTAQYQPVIRNKNTPLSVKDYIIRQDGQLIGRYLKTSPANGVSNTQTQFIIKSPNWKDIITATNGGFGSTNWEIVIIATNKHISFQTTSPIHTKALNQIVQYLVSNNYL